MLADNSTTTEEHAVITNGTHEIVWLILRR
jgi:hypothetical protein